MDVKRRYSTSSFAELVRREGDRLELKTGTGRALQDALVAFSNSEGGTILVGVDDARRLRGRRLDQGTSDAIHQQALACRDLGRYRILEIIVGATAIVAVTVEPRVEGFAQTSQGRVLVRRGASNVPLFGSDLAAFIAGRMLSRFEAHGTRVPVNQVEQAALAQVTDAHGWPQGDGTAERLVERGLATREGTLTIAGALLLTDPALSIEHAKAVVEVRRYPGEGVNYDRRESFGGPVQHQVESASRFVMDEIGRDLIVSGLYRYDMPRLPEVVVREAIANAVAHRSYEASGTATVIELRPDRVVVTSPGRLPEPVTLENIRDAQSARNPSLIAVLRRLRLAEDAGRGIDVIQDTMAEALLDPPRFEERDDGVRVVLPLLGPITSGERAWITELEAMGSLAGRDRLALVLAARGETLTNSRIREAMSLDAIGARRTLQRLRDAGLLVQHGHRGGTQYRLTERIAPPASYRLTSAELEKIVIALAEEGPVSNEAVRAATGLGRAEALGLLKSLVAKGTLRRVGQRRGTRYVRRRVSRR